MNKLLCGLLGALALCAVGTPGQAAPRADNPTIEAPAAIAIFHPETTASQVQTVQYYSHYYGHERPRGYGRPFAYRHGYRRPVFHRPHGYDHRGPFGREAPYRRY